MRVLINNRVSLNNRYQNKIHGKDPDISLNSHKFQEIKSYDTNSNFKDAFSVPTDKLAEFLTQPELNDAINPINCEVQVNLKHVLKNY